MGPGRQLLMISVFVLAATGCQGARLTTAQAPHTGPGRSTSTSTSTTVTAVTEKPAPPSEGPLTRRYYGSGQGGDEGAGRVLTDPRLDGIAQALERRRPETWAAPRRGRTAVQRSYDEADRYGPTSLTNPAQGMDPNGGIYVDIPGFVRFLGRLFR